MLFIIIIIIIIEGKYIRYKKNYFDFILFILLIKYNNNKKTQNKNIININSCYCYLLTYN
jgi:hypothetical protein